MLEMPPLTLLRLTLAKLLALGAGIALGTVLAMLPFEQEPAFYLASARSVIEYWFEDGGHSISWISAIEWAFAYGMSCYIALAASPIWGLLVWRKYANAKSAALLGAILGAMAGGLMAENAKHIVTTIFILIYATIGATCGLAVRMLDHHLAAQIRRQP